MKITSIATAFAILGTAFAAAAPPPSYGGKCISQQEGEAWLQKFIGVLGKTDPNAQTTANKIIADNFVEYSNSILSLQGLPVSKSSNPTPNHH